MIYMEKYDIKLDLKEKTKHFEKFLLSKKSNHLKDEDIMVYLIDKKIIKHECLFCGQKPFWNNKPLDLILDRKNNIFNDNRIYNLRLLCPNCFFQFKTKKTVFFKKTKTNVRKCIDCQKTIKGGTSGKGDKKHIIQRCKDCLEAKATGFSLEEFMT